MHARPHQRYALHSPVTLQTKGKRGSDGLLIELSQENARVSQLEPGRYTVGQSVTLKTPSGHSLEAYIHSIFGARANIRFAEALHLPELAELLDANRCEAAVA